MESRSSFFEQFHKSVQEVLELTLGEDAYQAYLQQSKPDMTVATADDVHENLTRIFDKAATDILEKVMTRRLLTKLGIHEDIKLDSFALSINEARKISESKRA